MRISFKERLARLRKTQVDLIEIMERDYGFNILPGDFSNSINGRLKTPKADKACELADRILTEIENK